MHANSGSKQRYISITTPFKPQCPYTFGDTFPLDSFFPILFYSEVCPLAHALTNVPDLELMLGMVPLSHPKTGCKA